MSAPIRRWVGELPPPEVTAALQRLARLDDVAAVAVMPDVHLSREVCIGTVIATRRLLYPAAIGGDVGCGVSLLHTGAEAAALAEPGVSDALLAGLSRLVPGLKQHRPDPLPAPLLAQDLSSPRLERLKQRDGRAQLGTLGRGNHFLELLRAEDGALWVMAHSGSRGMGPAIQAHHRARATLRSGGLEAIEADSAAGQAYRDDLDWAALYARLSRQRILAAAAALVEQLLGACPVPESYLDCDHNHVRRETHDGTALWVHRKGAIPAHDGQPGVIPGSMGAPSFVVEGRGCAAALCSSSHGAGRRLSRTEARRSITPSAFQRQVKGVRFDMDRAARFIEEAPLAYKDISAVMRAQSELTRIRSRLEPVLNYRI
jgi:tRNA-splicing ligase RtcB